MKELNTVQTESVNDTAEVVEEEQNGKFYTDEEIAKIQQIAGDKRISQYQKTLEKKSREAEKLNKMSAEERYEFQLQERERLIEEKEMQLVLAENKAAVSQILADKGLSLAFVDFVVDSDADVMQDRIKTIEKAFKQSVKAEVEKRLASKAPATSMAAFNGITKEQFSKMSLAQMQELANTEPETYQALTGR